VSRRRSVYEIVRRRVHGGHSPNAYVSEITVEIRVFWPPHLGHEQEVMDAVADAAYRVRAKVARVRAKEAAVAAEGQGR
jgi:hypothetical protein